MSNLNITPLVQKQLKENNLDWDVEKRILFYKDGTQDEGLLPSDKYGIVRKDTDNLLGVVSDQYEPKQNAEVLQVLHDSMKGHKLEVAKAGAFKGGRQIFVQLALPEDYHLNSDTLKRYLFVLTSHDGSTSLRFGLSNIVMSCQNQFNFFLKESKLTYRHTQSIHERIESLSEEVNFVLSREKLLYEAYEQFAKIDISKKEIEATVNHLLDLDKYLETHDEFSTRKENQIMDLRGSIDQEIHQKGETVWGLFNGITHYANHKKTFPKRENGQFESVMLGGGEWFMRRGFSFLTKNNDIKLNLN